MNNHPAFPRPENAPADFSTAGAFHILSLLILLIVQFRFHTGSDQCIRTNGFRTVAVRSHVIERIRLIGFNNAMDNLDGMIADITVSTRTASVADRVTHVRQSDAAAGIGIPMQKRQRHRTARCGFPELPYLGQGGLQAASEARILKAGLHDRPALLFSYPMLRFLR